MFQVKDFHSIVAAMVNHARRTQDRLTDFHIGAVARTLIEAPAVEIDEFYQRMLHGLLEAIPVAVYNAFDFQALGAVAASGDVRFTLEQLHAEPVVIPAGTVVKRPDSRLRYLVQTEATIPSGEWHVDARVVAEFTGVDGNVPAGTVTELVGAIEGLAAVSNPNALIGGREPETAAERKARFVDYIGSLSRGTVWAVTYAARRARVHDAAGLPVEYVTRLGLIEEAGHVDLYLWGSGGAPSAELIAAAQTAIDGDYTHETQTWTPGYRPVGVRVTVRPMVPKTVNLSLRVRMLDGFSGTTAVTSAIRDKLTPVLFSAMPGTVLYIEQILNAAVSASGVEIVLAANTANIPCGNDEVLVLGTVTVEWMT